jgi:hypothetical protein
MNLTPYGATSPRKRRTWRIDMANRKNIITNGHYIIANAAANWEGDSTIEDAICERFNCREARVAADGSVYIADPQRGHWIDAESHADLVCWMLDRKMIDLAA